MRGLAHRTPAPSASPRCPPRRPARRRRSRRASGTAVRRRTARRRLRVGARRPAAGLISLGSDELATAGQQRGGILASGGSAAHLRAAVAARALNARSPRRSARRTAPPGDRAGAPRGTRGGRRTPDARAQPQDAPLTAGQPSRQPLWRCTSAAGAVAVRIGAARAPRTGRSRRDDLRPLPARPGAELLSARRRPAAVAHPRGQPVPMCRGPPPSPARSRTAVDPGAPDPDAADAGGTGDGTDGTGRRAPAATASAARRGQRRRGHRRHRSGGRAVTEPAAGHAGTGGSGSWARAGAAIKIASTATC